MKKLVVAIDGPAGAGKSTVAQLAAKELGYTYIDTGAMYRAVAWKVLQQGGEVTDEKILAVIPDIDVDLSYENGKTTVRVDGQDVTGEIRTPEVSHIVSQVAALGPVREKMVDLQRKMAERGGVLMDGRDIATNVLPGADVKIYLTASIAERANRRYKELREKGLAVNLADIERDIAARDKADMEREISPLVQAEDATLLDTTGMTIPEVVARIIGMCRGYDALHNPSHHPCLHLPGPVSRQDGRQGTSARRGAGHPRGQPHEQLGPAAPRDVPAAPRLVHGQD